MRVVYSQDLVIHTKSLIEHINSCLSPLAEHIERPGRPADDDAKKLLHEAREKLCEAAQAITRDLGEIEISLATDLRDSTQHITGIALRNRAD